MERIYKNVLCELSCGLAKIMSCVLADHGMLAMVGRKNITVFCFQVFKLPQPLSS